MSFRFYPTLESRTGLEKKINVVSNEDFRFFRKNEFGINELTVNSGKIKDALWDYERDSLIVQKNVRISDPDFLVGREGIACSDAELGLCILWSNDTTSMAGCILPLQGSERKDENGWSVMFQHVFSPGELRGVLELKIVLYLKTAALTVKEGEEILNNSTGVVVGELECYLLEVSDATIPFPFVFESCDSNELWRVDFFSWEEPAEDGMFGPSSFVVTLNKKCPGCPIVNEKGFKNQEMMLEITVSVYALLFKKLTYQQFYEMKNSHGTLTPGTISAELFRVYSLCENKFEYEASYEQVHRSVQSALLGSAANSANDKEVSDA